VISFAMTAVLLVIALRSRAAQGNDHVDGAAGDDSDAQSGGSAR